MMSYWCWENMRELEPNENSGDRKGSYYYFAISTIEFTKNTTGIQKENLKFLKMFDSSHGNCLRSQKCALSYPKKNDNRRIRIKWKPWRAKNLLLFRYVAMEFGKNAMRKQKNWNIYNFIFDNCLGNCIRSVCIGEVVLCGWNYQFCCFRQIRSWFLRLWTAREGNLWLKIRFFEALFGLLVCEID